MALNAAAQPGQTLIRPHDISFRHEIQHAIDRGAEWLQSRQDTNGSWSPADEPAATALALTALMGGPSGASRAVPPSALERGYKFITNQAKLDGGIYEKDRVTLTTSICMMSLLAARNPQYDPLLRKARHWLIGQQTKFDEKAANSEQPFHWGLGDLNITVTALEALYYSEHLETPGNKSSADAATWNRTPAIHFIESCQNLPGWNTDSWVSTDPRDSGGFVDEPGNSKAGGVTNASEIVKLRSYGSASCAGLLGYTYAGLKPDDPRVRAACDWLRNNFTVDENPGVGRQGFYRYFLLLSKALTSYGIDQLPLKGGQTIDWRREVAMKLLNLQTADGSWINEHGSWWDDDPVVATAYSVISLEILYAGL
jgi:squalene-hopene/tetraprenyl-beta-curcumene cyclase